jgi:hypothetical protein
MVVALFWKQPLAIQPQVRECPTFYRSGQGARCHQSTPSAVELLQRNLRNNHKPKNEGTQKTWLTWLTNCENRTRKRFFRMHGSRSPWIHGHLQRNLEVTHDPQLKPRWNVVESIHGLGPNPIGVFASEDGVQCHLMAAPSWI